MESSTYPYERPPIPEGKFYFYSTCSPDLFLNGIEVELKMTYNPQQCKTYLKSQLCDKISNIDDYDLLVYLSGGIPFLGGTIGDMYSSTSEVHFKRYIYGILTRPISEKELNANYGELCNINDKTRKILISPICESTENGLIDMACILGYLSHGGLLSDKFLRCCSIVTHFPPLITCLNRILMQNEITGRDVITVTSSLFTFFSSLVWPFSDYYEVFNYAIMCCNYIIDIKVENETFPLMSLMNNNDPSVKFLMNLNQPKVVYFWEDDECGNKYEDFVYYRLEPFDLLEFKKVNPIFISFTPIPPLLIRNAFGCSIVKGKKHNYLYLSKSPLTTKIQGNNVDIINPKTGIIKSIDIEHFAAKQDNNEITNEFNLIDPEKVGQIMIICLDSSKSMSLTLEGSKMANSETRSLIAIQYLSIYTQKIIDYKIQSIQGLINFNSKVEFSSQFSPLSDKILTNALSNMKTTGESFIWDALSFACDEIVKFTLMEANKFKNAVKRIFVLSSGEDQGSNIPFIDVVKKLIDNEIIVDSLIFNNEEKGKQMCALSHMTGGFSFNITTVNDGLSIVENSTFLNHIPKNKIRIPYNLTIDFIQKIVSSSKFDTKIKNKEAKRAALEKRFATPKCICSRFTKVDNLHTRKSRILKELYLASLKIDQSTNPDNDGSIVVLPFESCLDKWSVFLKGAECTLYDKKWFSLLVTFPELYPIEPPVIRFLQIPYNLNVSPDGRVCIDVLNDGYLPSMHIIDIIYYVKEIFIIPDIEHPAQIAIYETFKNNINSYENNVRNSVLQVGKNDYKEFFTEGTKIDDSISDDLMKDQKELVPSYIKPKIMGKLMKDPVLASSGVYYEREELKQLIASHMNPICVVTGKSLTEKISDLDDICPSEEKFHKNYLETNVKSENDIKSENLMKTALIDQTDFYKLIKFKEDKSGEFYAAMVFYQNIKKKENIEMVESNDKYQLSINY